MARSCSSSWRSFCSSFAGLTLWTGVALAASFQPDPLPQPIEWDAKSSVVIPSLGKHNEFITPSTPSRFAAIGIGGFDSSGAEVWDLVKGKRHGALKGKPASSSDFALSPDGRYLAVKALKSGQPTNIEIWSFESGQMVTAVEGAPLNQHVQLFDFADKDQVIVYTFGPSPEKKFVYYLRQYELPSGKLLQQIDFTEQLNPKLMTLSQGRRQLAYIEQANSDKAAVKVVDLASKQLLAEVSLRDAKPEKYSISWSACAFDAAGQSLALLGTELAATHLVIVDLAKGEIDAQHTFPGNLSLALGASSYKGELVAWLPDGQGWLLYGTVVIDRETGLLVWQLKRPTDDHSANPRIPVASGVLAAVGPYGQKSLRRIEYPAEQISKSVAAYRDDAPARVRPGGSVELKLNIGAVRFGTPDEARKMFTDLFTERLAGDGIDVKDQSDTVLHVSYSEAAGSELDIVKGNGPGGFLRGTPTGQKVQTTKGAVQIVWKSRDGKETFWTGEVALDPKFMTFRTGEVNAEAARKGMLDMIQYQLSGLPLPYFIPVDKQTSQLPAVTAIGGENDKEQKDDRLKRKVDAKKKMMKRR
jgi:hypothetical protein